MNRLIFLTLLSLSLNTSTAFGMDNSGDPVNQECPICSESLSGNIVSSNPLFGCHHEGTVYHDGCMANWLNTRIQNALCPLCRAHLLDLHGRLAEFSAQPQVAAALTNIYPPAPAEAIPAAHFYAETLLNAACNGDLKLANACLNHGIGVNVRNNSGWTALIYAAFMSHLAIVEQLLVHPNIDVNAHDINGYTALMFAANHGQLAIVERLLANPDIDVNAHSNFGYTALDVAHNDAIRTLLIARGAHSGLA